MTSICLLLERSKSRSLKSWLKAFLGEKKGGASITDDVTPKISFEGVFSEGSHLPVCSAIHLI